MYDDLLAVDFRDAVVEAFHVSKVEEEFRVDVGVGSYAGGHEDGGPLFFFEEISCGLGVLKGLPCHATVL